MTQANHLPSLEMAVERNDFQDFMSSTVTTLGVFAFASSCSLSFFSCAAAGPVTSRRLNNVNQQADLACKRIVSLLVKVSDAGEEPNGRHSN